jgi:hypothetical protein
MADLLPILQTAIGPVILVSGIGLLILSMTNRLGRAIDRARQIGGQLEHVTPAARQPLEAQLRILWRRANVIRAGISLAAGSALAAALLVIVIFISAISGLEAGWMVAALFVLCMMSLIASLVLFIHDVNQGLAALELEYELLGLADDGQPKRPPPQGGHPAT